VGEDAEGEDEAVDVLCVAKVGGSSWCWRPGMRIFWEDACCYVVDGGTESVVDCDGEERKCLPEGDEKLTGFGFTINVTGMLEPAGT